jgi:AraC-like DNA-binding protein
MKLGALDIINIIASFQLIVFVYFLIRKKSNIQSNRMLALFLFIQLIIILNFEVFHLAKKSGLIVPHLFYAGTPLMFLASPVFYLYVKSVAFSDFRFTLKQSIHFALFIAATIAFAILVFPLSAEMKTELVFNRNNSLDWLFRACNVVAAIQFAAYFIANWIVLINYRKKIREQYSSVQNINLSWLNVVLWGFFISCCSTFLVNLIGNFLVSVYDIFLFLNFFSFFVYFNIIFFKGLTRPEIFSGVEEKVKYSSSKLKEREGESLFIKLTSYMEANKPYLDPSITLKELASRTGISARYLSQIINEYANKNFFDYIAWYRIEESKIKLADPESNKTILEVLYSAGFNSKSSFNAAFKKFTGTTPSDYKMKKCA